MGDHPASSSGRKAVIGGTAVAASDGRGTRLEQKGLVCDVLMLRAIERTVRDALAVVA